MLKKKKFVIGGVIVFLAIGYLGYVGFQSAASYYYTVSELTALGDSVSGKVIRVNGLVAEPVERITSDLTLKFIIAEGGQSLPVVYRGVVPDSFRLGGDIVVEGTLDTSGVFRATTLLPKCPSRYEPVEKAPQTTEVNSWQI